LGLYCRVQRARLLPWQLGQNQTRWFSLRHELPPKKHLAPIFILRGGFNSAVRRKWRRQSQRSLKKAQRAPIPKGSISIVFVPSEGTTDPSTTSPFGGLKGVYCLPRQVLVLSVDRGPVLKIQVLLFKARWNLSRTTEELHIGLVQSRRVGLASPARVPLHAGPIYVINAGQGQEPPPGYPIRPDNLPRANRPGVKMSPSLSTRAASSITTKQLWSHQAPAPGVLI